MRKILLLTALLSYIFIGSLHAATDTTTVTCSDPKAINYGKPEACKYDTTQIPQYCDDLKAINFGKPEPCKYDTTQVQYCDDPKAINFGKPEACRYDTTQVPKNCEDPKAINYGKPEPCRYDTTQVPKYCEDPKAINYGKPEPCKYDTTQAQYCDDPKAINFGKPEACRYDTTQLPKYCEDPKAINYGKPEPCKYDTTQVQYCKDPKAINFGKPEACIFDTISNYVYGCTDKLALNFDPGAQINNGTCIYDTTEIKRCEDPKAINFGKLEACIYEGNPTIIIGCTNIKAVNYNSLATIDDGSCKFENIIWGCTDMRASNYNASANKNDGSCRYEIIIKGCTDKRASNYNPDATYESGDCKYDVTLVYGCTDKNALNFNPYATIEDKSCIYRLVSDSVKGCTDKAARNYNPVALIDDGSCVYVNIGILPGCTDPKAVNYNPKATNDDKSCVYAKPIDIVIKSDSVKADFELGTSPIEACALNTELPVDSAKIDSYEKVNDKLVIHWIVYQNGNVFNVASEYSHGNQWGNVRFYLSMICKSELKAINPKLRVYTYSDYKGILLPTATDESEPILSSAFPNPFKDYLNVELGSLVATNVSLSSISGVQVYLTSQISGNSFQINTELLPTGMYILKLVYENGSVKHIVVSKQD